MLWALFVNTLLCRFRMHGAMNARADRWWQPWWAAVRPVSGGRCLGPARGRGPIRRAYAPPRLIRPAPSFRPHTPHIRLLPRERRMD